MQAVFRGLALFTLMLFLPVLAQAQYQGVTLGANLSPENVHSLRDDWGLKFVVYPIIIGNAEYLNETAYFDALDSALDRLDVLMPHFEAKGIKIFLKLYSPPGGFSVHTQGKSQQAVFAYPWASAALVTTWQLIATRYAANTTIVGYHILNEPAVGKKPIVKWNALAMQVVNAIRAIDTSHLIGVSSEYGNPVKISSLKSFVGIPNVVLIVHAYYLPYSQQGLYGRPALPYSTKIYKKFAKVLGPAIKMKRKGARVAVLEFSAVRTASGVAQFISDAVNLFKTHGFDWAYHGLYEAPEWDPSGTAQGEVLKQHFALVP